MTIDAMKNIGTWPSGFAGAAGSLAAGACCATSRSTFDSASVVISNTTPWTRLTLDMDVPPDTYQVWGWMMYNAPSTGRVWFDDASLEVLGPAKVHAPEKPKPPRVAGRRLGR